MSELLDLDEMEAGYLVLVAAVMLAQERQRIGITAAYQATGLDQEQYRDLRMALVAAGVSLQRRIAAGLAREGAA